MSRKTRSLFNSQRAYAPSTRRRIDIGIVIAGLVVALVLGVLTWFNYQDHQTSANAQLSDDRAPTKR